MKLTRDYDNDSTNTTEKDNNNNRYNQKLIITTSIVPFLMICLSFETGVLVTGVIKLTC